VVGAYKAARGELLACARVGNGTTPPVASAPPPKRRAARGGGREADDGSNGRSEGRGASGAGRAEPDDPPPAAARRSTRRSAQADAAPATTTQLDPATTKAKDRSTKRTRSSARGAAAEDLPEPGRTKRRSAGIRPTQETETEEANGKEKVGQELGQGEHEIGEEIGEEDEEEEKEEESPQSPASWRTQGDDDAVSESDWDGGDGSADVVDLSEDGADAGAPAADPGSGQNQRPGTVNGPICGIGILEGLINSHIDTCLIRASEGRVGEVSAEKAPRGRDGADQNMAPRACTTAKLPKLVYHIMKDKALKKLLADAGLNATGTRAQMISRHKEFTLRVNASIDSGHEPNVANIARDVTKLERDRTRAEKPNGLVVGALPTAAAAETNKADTFNKLIAAVRERSANSNRE
jgi:E3 ubiquitin-protein ligase RAD18